MYIYICIVSNDFVLTVASNGWKRAYKASSNFWKGMNFNVQLKTVVQKCWWLILEYRCEINQYETGMDSTCGHVVVSIGGTPFIIYVNGMFREINTIYVLEAPPWKAPCQKWTFTEKFFKIPHPTCWDLPTRFWLVRSNILCIKFRHEPMTISTLALNSEDFGPKLRWFSMSWMYWSLFLGGE